MNKIVFLDIDGPVIDIDSPVIASELRLTHNPQSIEMLNELCWKTGAKIVTNSMHNYNVPYDSTLRDDLIKWGVDEDYIHDQWRTIFPHVDYSKVNSPVRGIGRLVAIETWLAENGNYDWICFDDRKFTDSHRLIHIEDGLGIREHHVEQALEVFSPFV